MNTHQAIFFVLNKGHVDEAMAAAREAGATGGTVLSARGVASAEEAEKRFGISIQQEKEILLILAPAEKCAEIMSAISKSAGLNTPGRGIGFTLPVDEVIGASRPQRKDE